MSPKEERAYSQGSAAAYRSLLATCLAALGYSDPETANANHWVLERADTVAMLRQVCEDFGDNDWDDDLYLPDVIEKHLMRHLWDGETETDESEEPS